MKRLTLFTTALVLAVLAVLATHIRAQETNTDQRTIMTFSSAVELPGVTLEPGTYEFRLADTPQRNVVQVFRKEGDQSVGGKPMGQWTFIPAERPRASDETVVMFKEAREGTTPAIQYWYFPSERIGKEFIYPKEQAEKIAARTGQAVRSEDGPVSASANASAASATTAAASNDSARPAPEADAAAANAAAAPGEPVASQAATPAEPAARQPATPESITARAEVDNPQSPAVTPEPRPVGTSGIADAPQTPQQAPAPRQAQQPTAEARPAQASADLPKTASPLPLTGLIGLMSLAGAAALRFVRG
jgi:pyruvate/2-oxoglutarate dehydrogenase complex dihydrolipoamide acyltransferase (E2) component